MIAVHPAFDVETRTWFAELEHGTIEASALVFLKQKLNAVFKRKRFSIIGYFPRGFACPVWPKDVPPRVPMPHTQGITSYRPPAREAVGEAPKREKNGREDLRHYDHGAVLDAWATGRETSGEIAERLGMNSASAVRVIVLKARANGDARAVSRLHARIR